MKKRRLILAALLCAAANVSVYAVDSVPSESVRYDVNRDGKINAHDIVAMMRFIADGRTDIESGSYDNNGDGKANSVDLIRLMKYIASGGTDSTDSSDPGITSDVLDTSDAPVTDDTSGVVTDSPVPDTPEVEIKALNDKYLNTLSVIANRLPGIVCWGDSLTSGPGGNAMTYPKSLQNSINDAICLVYDPLASLSDEAKALVNPEDYKISIPVINMGVGGETTNTILGRNGAVPFVTSGSITIPSGTTPVRIKFISQNGRTVAPLLQGSAGMEYVTIAGVRGVISNSYGGYTFARSEAGSEVTVPSGTVITTAGSENYRDYITVIFIGQNGGFIGYDDLVEQQRAIIDHQTRNNDRYIIIGLHTTTPSYRDDLEGLMVEEYGDKYINLREYMATDAIYDAGLEPTQDDLYRMQMGYTPFSLLAIDELHFNATGYELIGKLVYNRMESLGYFDEVKTSAGIS
ncbi:MAG: dockerin type I domain-containing protein [Clostridia bacterium]|nr:dockerin type I domain-containing protein [Clostridia bacterium]